MLRTVHANAMDPEVAVGDIMEVMEEVIDMTAVLDAAEVAEDELLLLVEVELEASGLFWASAAQAVALAGLEPTYDPMLAITA